MTLTRTFEVVRASFFCWGRSEMKVGRVFFPTWGHSLSDDAVSDEYSSDLWLRASSCAGAEALGLRRVQDSVVTGQDRCGDV